MNLLKNIEVPFESCLLGPKQLGCWIKSKYSLRYIDNRARQRKQADDAYSKNPLPQSVLDLCRDGFNPDEGYDTQEDLQDSDEDE